MKIINGMYNTYENNRYTLRGDIVQGMFLVTLIDRETLRYEDLSANKPLPASVGYERVRREFEYWNETVRGHLAVGEYPIQ